MSPTSKNSGRGSKASYTDKQKRQAEHIEKSYESRGVSKKTAEARAWATVNKTTGGGAKSGSGRKHHHYSTFNDYRELLKGEHFFTSFPLCL